MDDDLVDYVAKGGPTMCSFSVMVAPGALRPGEHCALRGNLAALGGGSTSVPLEQSADDPRIWQLDVEIPIGLDENHKRGLFEFRYTIESLGSGEVTVELEEGGVTRRPERMHSHFYHNFKSFIDPDNGRATVGDRVRLAPGMVSQGSLKVGLIGEITQDDRDHLPYKITGPDNSFSWYKETDVVLVTPRPPPTNSSDRVDPHVAAGEAFYLFFRREWSLLSDGRLDPKEFLPRFRGLVDGVPGRVRADGEALFDELLSEYTASGSAVPPVSVLVLVGAMGVFGQSSAEREWVTTTMGGGYFRAKTMAAPQCVHRIYSTRAARTAAPRACNAWC